MTHLITKSLPERWLSSGLLLRVVWYKFIDVLEVLAASIIRAMIALMMEAVFHHGGLD
jgi:hypothetical protein